MTIETEYRGYKLTLDETSEKWSCRGLDIEECISLKACRAAVDRLSAADRRLNVKALVLDGRSEHHAIKEVVVTILCEPKKGWGQTDPAVSKVWTMDGGQRAQYSMEHLYPASARADLEELLRLEAAARTASRAVSNHHNRIERHNADTLSLEAREAKAAKAEA